MCSYLNENELTGRRPQKVHGIGTGGEEKPRRKIYVGFSRDYMPVGCDSNIYVGLNLYQEGIIEVRGVSHNKFLFGGNSVFAFDKEIKNNPCEYIQKLAEENHCEIDYSPAIDRGLNMINRLEAIVEDGAKILGVAVV